MDIDQWLADEKARLDRFRAWYLAQQQANPGECWPLEQPPGEWDDQYHMFPDQDAPPVNPPA